MEIYVNEPFLKKRAKISKYCTWGGMAALLLGLFMAQRNILASYAGLLVGMASAMVGAHFTSTYVREPRADQVFSHLLDGLDKRYALYCYYLPANIVVISHYGLTVLLAKAQKGEINYVNGRWQHKAGLRKALQLIGEPGLGNPEKELNTEVEWVEGWVAKNLPEMEVPVQGVVVFTHPEAVAHVKDAPVAAMPSPDLPEYLKTGMKGRTTLTTANQKELRRALDAVVASGKRQ
ncbi:MAG: nuclease-related domain-containing protein [Anaerolineae bacterium]